MKTQQKSTHTICQISTLFAEDSLVRLFHSLESGVDLKTHEEPFSLKSLESQPLKDLHIFSLKTYPVCYLTTGAKRLRLSSARFLNWGTMSAGRCLTARISVFPKPEKECILSDILEDNAPEKYFLSERQMERLLSKLSLDERGTESTPQEESE